MTTQFWKSDRLIIQSTNFPLTIRYKDVIRPNILSAINSLLKLMSVDSKKKIIIQLVKKVDISDLAIVLALILLAYAAVLLYQRAELDANQIARYAYYSLIVGIIWKIIRHVIKRKINYRKKQISSNYHEN
jgi:L-fucose mutarotase/ribose pyranase (RbsD/FucU family)